MIGVSPSADINLNGRKAKKVKVKMRSKKLMRYKRRGSIRVKIKQRQVKNCYAELRSHI